MDWKFLKKNLSQKFMKSFNKEHRHSSQTYPEISPLALALT